MGRKKKYLSDSDRKKAKKERDSLRTRQKIFLGEAAGRWHKLAASLGLRNPELANLLMNRYEDSLSSSTSTPLRLDCRDPNSLVDSRHLEGETDEFSEGTTTEEDEYPIDGNERKDRVTEDISQYLASQKTVSLSVHGKWIDPVPQINHSKSAKRQKREKQSGRKKTKYVSETLSNGEIPPRQEYDNWQASITDEIKVKTEPDSDTDCDGTPPMKEVIDENEGYKCKGNDMQDSSSGTDHLDVDGSPQGHSDYQSSSPIKKEPEDEEGQTGLYMACESEPASTEDQGLGRKEGENKDVTPRCFKRNKYGMFSS